jgi:hypothetical protein
MQTKWIWALALLNVFLLVGLVTHWMPSRAEAQMGNGGAAAAGMTNPSDYLMIPGEIVGGPGGSVVYIIDQNTGELTFVQYGGQVGGNPINVGQPIDLIRLLK